MCRFAERFKVLANVSFNFSYVWYEGFEEISSSNKIIFFCSGNNFILTKNYVESYLRKLRRIYEFFRKALFNWPNTPEAGFHL